MACIFFMNDFLAQLSAVLIVSMAPAPRVLATHEISLEQRYPVQSVNEVFKYNILYTLDLMGDKEFVLQPGETFAFHEDVLPEYQQSLVKTTNSHFNAQEGFKFSGLYYGDGVCHLASLIYWAALDAGLEAKAPVNHDFRAIPEIDKKYGVSIYYYPGRVSSNARQNLYITNNKEKPVEFKFEYKDDKLSLSIVEGK